MYQQYVNAHRVTQYQQQCLRDAAMARGLHPDRAARSPRPEVKKARVRLFFAGVK